MITKKVSRHYCEFCHRGSFKKPTMAKHERGCGLNPNRICGLCEYAELQQVSPAQLVKSFEDSGWSLDSLRKEAHNCPGCILATIRQSKINEANPEEAIWFDFKKELEEFWQLANEAKQTYADEIHF